MRRIVRARFDIFFSNSGAKAVEGAVKLARDATRQPNIIVLQVISHGRTVLTMALTTSKTVYEHWCLASRRICASLTLQAET